MAQPGRVPGQRTPTEGRGGSPEGAQAAEPRRVGAGPRLVRGPSPEALGAPEAPAASARGGQNGRVDHARGLRGRGPPDIRDAPGAAWEGRRARRGPRRLPGVVGPRTRRGRRLPIRLPPGGRAKGRRGPVVLAELRVEWRVRGAVLPPRRIVQARPHRAKARPDDAEASSQLGRLALRERRGPGGQPFRGPEVRLPLLRCRLRRQRLHPNRAGAGSGRARTRHLGGCHLAGRPAARGPRVVHAAS